MDLLATTGLSIGGVVAIVLAGVAGAASLALLRARRPRARQPFDLGSGR